MKKIRAAKKPRSHDEEMLPEYRLDYSKARPNRFAARIKHGGRLVLIEPDVAEVFSTPESVNTILRAVISALPSQASESISRNNG